MTVCRTNLDDVPKLVDLAVELGARSVSYQRLNAGLDYTARTVDGGYWNYVGESQLDPARSDAAVREAFRKAKAAGIAASFIGKPFISQESPEAGPAGAERAASAEPPPGARENAASVQACMKPWRELSVMPDGEARICCYHDYPRCSIGNVLDGDFMEIWNSPRIVARARIVSRARLLEGVLREGACRLCPQGTRVRL